jgi:hypothetical protein
MMQQILGHLDDFLVLAIFIYLILLLNGKVKMRQDRQEKFDKLIRRRVTLLKVLAYGGALIFVALILIQLIHLG